MRIAAPRTVGLALVALALGGLALPGLAGCTKSSPRASAPPSSPPASSSSASAPASSAPATPATAPTLGGECDVLLPVAEVDDAVGRPVFGRTAFVRGVAEPNIGRLTYLNCRYGLAAPVKGKPAPQPLVEVGISLYNSASQAATRVQGTVADYRSHGASQQNIVVGKDPATILLGYGSPTLVVAEGPRTVAVSVDPKMIVGQPNAALTQLAHAALVATSDFDGVPGVTATPSPGTALGGGSDSGMPSDSASASESPSPSGS